MPAKDFYRPRVVGALLADGWTITHDPLSLRIGGKDIFLAVREHVFHDIFEEPMGRMLLDNKRVRLIVVDVAQGDRAMGAVTDEREVIRACLRGFVNVRYAHGDIQNETVFDEAAGRYLVVSQGWMGKRRVHGCLIHVESRRPASRASSPPPERRGHGGVSAYTS